MRIRIRTEDSLQWVCAKDKKLTDEQLKKYGDGELTSKVRIREEGSETLPQLIEIQYEPNAEIQIHAHDEDEIIFVREGEMHLGNRVVGPGTSVFVAGNTLYGFKAGPQGLQILNFRPRKDITFISPAEFAARKHEVKAS